MNPPRAGPCARATPNNKSTAALPRKILNFVLPLLVGTTPVALRRLAEAQISHNPIFAL
jgi:hypothetical protein